MDRDEPDDVEAAVEVALLAAADACRRGSMPEAGEIYDDVLQRAGIAARPRLLGAARFGKSVVATLQADEAIAVASLAAAIEAWSQDADSAWTPTVVTVLGAALRDGGFVQVAGIQYERALALTIAAHLDALASAFLGELGLNAIVEDREADARSAWERGLILSRAAGVHELELSHLVNLAWLDLRQDDRQGAAGRLDATFESPGDTGRTSLGLYGAGVRACVEGDLGSAIPMLEEAYRFAAAAGEVSVATVAAVALARIALAQGDRAVALAHAERAGDQAMTTEDRTLVDELVAQISESELTAGCP